MKAVLRNPVRVWQYVVALCVGALSVAAQAQGIGSLTLIPATIAGGSGATSIATVTLTAPAAPGGVTVSLSSSNTDLAASTPTLTIPAGATQGTAVVATNALYRRYSGLAFNALISAAAAGTSASAALNVTAQARPGAFPSDTSQRSGQMCGGSSYARRGDLGVLFDCSLAPNFGTTGSCTFRQECTQGCVTRQASSFTSFRDVCAASGPFPVALSPRVLVGGGIAQGSVQLATASQASPLTVQALVSNNNIFAGATPTGYFSIPVGSTTGSFSVTTEPVAVPNFAPIGVSIETPEPLSGGGLFISRRLATAWLAFVPPPTDLPVAMASLALSPASVVGGNASTGTLTLTQPAPPSGALVRLRSDRTDAANVDFSVTVPAGQTTWPFTITTSVQSSTVPATITAGLGGIITAAALSVTGAPPAISVSSLSFTPTSVLGGGSVQGRVTLTQAVSSNTVVTLTNDRPDIATVPATVTVPAGTFAANFNVTTNAVTANATATVSASFGGATRSSTLNVTAPAGGGALPAPALVSPASGTRFNAGSTVTFDWADVAGASSYTLEVDTTSTIAAPLTATRSVTVSQVSVSGLPTRRLWWRVRAIDASGNPGAWSAVRQIELK